MRYQISLYYTAYNYYAKASIQLCYIFLRDSITSASPFYILIYIVLEVFYISKALILDLGFIILITQVS